MTRKNTYSKYDDKELFCLDTTIARFVLPRLMRFKEVSWGRPIDEETKLPVSKDEWSDIIDSIIYSMDWIATDEEVFPEDPERIQRGLDLFGKHFRSLWC